MPPAALHHGYRLQLLARLKSTGEGLGEFLPVRPEQIPLAHEAVEPAAPYPGSIRYRPLGTRLASAPAIASHAEK